MGERSNESPPNGVVFSTADGLVTATEVSSGVAASGATNGEALSRLAEALVLREGGGEAIGNEEAFLSELGVEVDDLTDESDPPWLE